MPAVEVIMSVWGRQDVIDEYQSGLFIQACLVNVKEKKEKKPRQVASSEENLKSLFKVLLSVYKTK